MPSIPCVRMAGTFGAIPHFLVSYKPLHQPSSAILKPFSISKLNHGYNFFSRAFPFPHLNMAANGINSFFRVKRLSDNAVLPSRGSPLSAGYDLSRFPPFFFFLNFMNRSHESKSFLNLVCNQFWESVTFSLPTSGAVRRRQKCQPGERL